jgi:hypothetical protein
MKKSLILLVVLLAVGALAFAEDVKPTWTVSGSASAIIGYDLNAGGGGIRNSQAFDFDFAFFPTQTFSKGGDGKLYGMIQVADVHFGIISGLWDTTGAEADYYSTFADDVKNSSGTITAKVVYDPFYVLVSKGLDDMRFNYAANTDGYSDVNFFGLSALFPSAGTIALGYGSKMISARATILSVGNEANIPATAQVDKADPSAFFASGVGHTDPVTARTVNSGSWAYGLWVTANPIAMLGVDLKAVLFTDTVTSTNNWAGFGGSLTLKPVDMISLVVGADAYSDLAAAFEMDVKPALTVNLGDDTLTASMYYTTYAVAATDSELDASVKFVEADADKGYIPGVGASVEFGLNNLVPLAPAVMTWSVDVLANYTMGAWKPYAEFKMSANTAADAQMIKVNAGVAFTGIANTAVTLDYIATDLTNVEPGTWNDKGIISLKTKISY